MAKKMLVLSVLLAAVMLHSGCASILSKSEYPVLISSDPDGANFSIVDRNGVMVTKGVTPETVVLKAGDGWFRGKDYVVTFDKPGYQKEEMKIDQKLDNWYLFGNILVGGLIGWVIVDPLTGAMWELEDLNVVLFKDKGVGASNMRMRSYDVPTAEQACSIIKTTCVRLN